jgi:crotonobetainyl-CoA:carnitine CoA-transferase CaiB-like acyl-CoA transferase
MNTTAVTGALSHIRVLDLSRVLAGPWCTQNLADMGAEVIKVERPRVGDDTRSWGPPWIASADGSDSTDSTYFASTNRNKKSITIDMSKPGGQALIRELARSADVVIENYKVGDLKRYGLDYAALSEVNPKLVYLSVTGYGQSGPDSHKPGYDVVFQATGGIMSITGEEDGKPGGGPQKAGIAIADILTGQYATIAVLAALAHRSVSGKGQYIDMALLDCIVALGSNQVTGFFRSGRIPRRWGNGHPTVVPYQPFRAADGDVIVAVGNDEQFRRFCHVLGREDLAADPKFRRSAGRVTNRDELLPQIAATMATRPGQEWVDKLEANNVPCGRINNYQQVFEEPQVRHRKLRVDMERSDGGKVATIASPIRLQGTPPQYVKAPPLLGEHTDVVLKDVLGKSDAEIAALRDAGVV